MNHHDRNGRWQTRPELAAREPGNREFPEGDNFVPKIQPSWHKFNFNTKKCNGRA
jgi:hypothetical protein